ARKGAGAGATTGRMMTICVFRGQRRRLICSGRALKRLQTMSDSLLVDSLKSQLDDLRSRGLYKRERHLQGPQGAAIRVVREGRGRAWRRVRCRQTDKGTGNLLASLLAQRVPRHPCLVP